jgi:H+/Cl- antiporter ClcA
MRLILEPKYVLVLSTPSSVAVPIKMPESEASQSLKKRFSSRYQLVLVGEGLLVGIFGGAAVTLYRMSLSAAERLLRFITGLAVGHPLAVVGWFAVLAVLCFIVCRLMLWEPYTQGSGIPQTDAEVMGRINMPWHRVMVAKFVEGTLCAFGGLSLGREGPAVQLGAVSGKAVSRGFKRGRGEERLLMTCGAAAGMSAAFSAPLTGVLFALEEIHKEFTAPLILTVMASSVASDFLVSQVLGVSPVLKLVFLRDLPHADYLTVCALGVVCGFLGALHNKGMFDCQDKLYGRIKKYLPYSRIAIPFAIAGVAAFAFPQLMCGGDAIIELMTSHYNQPLLLLVGLLVGKYLFTTVSFASGAPGGTLFPLVVMGVLIGAIFGTCVIDLTGMPQEYIANFVVMGVAGLFAGVVRAPVTAVVLAFELTGSLDALLSVTIVSIIAFLVANLLEIDPFYEHLLANLLGSTPHDPQSNGKAGEKVLHSCWVGAGSQLEGKLIRDIDWPRDVRVVTVDRAGQEIVPTGSTRLLALDEILLIMNTDTEDESQEWVWNVSRGSITSQNFPRST